jgi:hypothetical protein
MPASDPTSSTPSDPSPELLDVVVSGLIEATIAGGDGDGFRPPTLVNVVVDPGADDGFRIGLLDPPGDPYETLLGFTAPPEWFAMGMLTAGWTYPPDIAEAVDFTRQRFLPVPPSQHPRRLRIHTAYLCTRRGDAYGRTVVADGRTIDEAPSGGRMVDAFRRALGLATDPPPVGVEELFTLRWLTSIAGIARLEGRTLDWNEVAGLHDAVALLDLEPDQIDEAAPALHRAGSWERLRQLAAEGKGLVPSMTADDAAWMDEGMFARDVLACYPSVAVLLDELSGAVGNRTARRVRERLRSWGIDTTPWAA